MKANEKNERLTPMFLTTAEVAQILRLGVSTVWRMATNDEIPGARRIGGQWRFNRQKLLVWLDANGG